MNGGDWADLISIVVPAIAGAVVAANQPLVQQPPPVPQAVVVDAPPPVPQASDYYTMPKSRDYSEPEIPDFPLVSRWLEKDGWVCNYSNGAQYRKEPGCLAFVQ
jgi:hypothetical protein